MNPTTIGWLAGLMDGEGSIGIRLEQHHDRPERPVYLVAAVQMSMTDKPTVDRVLEVLREVGVRGAGYTYQERDPAKHLDAHYLRVARLADILVLAGLMEPVAVTKRRQWRLILEYAESRLEGRSVDRRGRAQRGGLKGKRFSDREIEIARELHILNMRGPAAIARDNAWRKKLASL